MKKATLRLLLTFCIYVGVFAVLRFLFMLAQWDTYSGYGEALWLRAMAHGFAMDCSVAGYMSVIPAMLFSVEAGAGRRRWIDVMTNGWFAVSGVLVAMIFVLDTLLYGYWGFRLDVTPFFYFSTSPSAALASARWYEIVSGLVGVAAVSMGIRWLLRRCVSTVGVDARSSFSIVPMMGMFVVSALLIIPIRGGFGVAPMNLSRAYYCADNRLNHAAINPVFSLLYSATHQNNGADQFHYMDESEAVEAVEEYRSMLLEGSPDSIAPRLTTVVRPDIWIVILESFSSHLLPSAGGDSVAVGLDSIARSGLWFTNFYANSFRTDRALPSILSGFPALPTVSLLKHVDKVEKLPSLADEFGSAGYATRYFYGGDINFANMQAYMVSGGFETIVSESDFPNDMRTAKWGVPDGPLFEYVFQNAGCDRPSFNVIQTSSSHEPFEVPYSNPDFKGEPAKNAFAYTDSCLTAFVDRLKQSPAWGKSLVVCVPDHLGAWPLGLENAVDRHHVPLVITGGALNPLLAGTRNATPGSQADMAATLLTVISGRVDRFPFSSNLLDATQGHIAVFSEPEIVGFVSASDTLIYNLQQDSFYGSGNTQAQKALKAILQQQYGAASAL